MTLEKAGSFFYFVVWPATIAHMAGYLWWRGEHRMACALAMAYPAAKSALGLVAWHRMWKGRQ